MIRTLKIARLTVNIYPRLSDLYTERTCSTVFERNIVALSHEGFGFGRKSSGFVPSRGGTYRHLQLEDHSLTSLERQGTKERSRRRPLLVGLARVCIMPRSIAFEDELCELGTHAHVDVRKWERHPAVPALQLDEVLGGRRAVVQKKKKRGDGERFGYGSCS